MRYPAFITREDESVLVRFPDCVGCQTQVDAGEDLKKVGTEALEGWLEASLEDGRLPPRPSTRVRAPAGNRLSFFEVAPRLSLKLELRWARASAGLTQAALARRLGVSQSQIAQLENPDSNPTIDTIVKAVKALGAQLSISIEPKAATPKRKAAGSR